MLCEALACCQLHTIFFILGLTVITIRAARPRPLRAEGCVVDAFGHDLTLQCWTAVSRPWQARAVVRSSLEVTSSSRCLECAYPDSGIFSRGAARERERRKK